jgi:hypothetical protein
MRASQEYALAKVEKILQQINTLNKTADHDWPYLVGQANGLAANALIELECVGLLPSKKSFG